jgi:hypothetical protein
MVFIDQGFQVEASGDLPDLHSIYFEVEAESSNSEETWSSDFTVTGHAGILTYEGYDISNEEGNGNGRLDPGETADMNIRVINTGTSKAYNVTGTLESASEYIALVVNTYSYGDIEVGDTALLVYEITADGSTPEGHSAFFTFNAGADLGLTLENTFYSVVGQVPVLVVDKDPNTTAPNAIMTCLENLGVGATYETSIPENLNVYSSVFVCLGTFPENYILTYDEGTLLANYLSQGGNIYMEGGDTWFYDQQSNPTPVHPMFSINGLADGNGDLTTVIGMTGTPAEGMYLEYDGDNAYIDHIEAEGDAKSMFLNGNPQYYCAVSYDQGDYRTIGSSFEFGGITDDDFTRDDYMIRILDFFGIDGVWTSTGENIGESTMNDLSVAPNPFRDNVTIRFIIDKSTWASVEVYSLNGSKVDEITSGHFDRGEHMFTWDGTDMEGRELPPGIYFLNLRAQELLFTRKVVVLR